MGWGGHTCGFEGIVNVADSSLVIEPQVFITLYFIIYNVTYSFRTYQILHIDGLKIRGREQRSRCTII